MLSRLFRASDDGTRGEVGFSGGEEAALSHNNAGGGKERGREGTPGELPISRRRRLLRLFPMRLK